MNIHRSQLTIIALFCAALLSAQTTNLANYYSAANGKKKAELKTALYHIIGHPNWQSYGSLWTHYYNTDRASDNQVIDRYSNNKRYFTSNNGNQVSGMNKEHGIAQSWWGGGTTKQGSDLHHVMPSDAEANNRKSNFGMGVVTSQTWSNGSIKVGRGTAGNNGTVQLWEPADNWKGDFARAYFYIVTAYEELNMVQSEGANSMQANTYPKLQPWCQKLYLQWAKEDPVDDLERKRNEAVYKIQGNRNPFIDYPSLAEYIWGDSIDYAFYVDGTHDIDPIVPVDPDTTQVDTTHVDPIDPIDPVDPDEPTGKSGTVEVNSCTWIATQTDSDGAGYMTQANGLLLAYYKHNSNVNPVPVSQYNELRFYANSLFVISGAEITKVVFHSSGRAADMTIGQQSYSFKDGALTWTGSMNPFMAEASGGQSRISSIDITVKDDSDGLLPNYMSPVAGMDAVFDIRGNYLGTQLPSRRGIYIIRQNGVTHKHCIQ